MIYVEAPNPVPAEAKGKKVLFMAGGITNCPDWQVMLKNRLSHLDLVLINPRRAGFDVTNPNMELEQITWEHNMLEKADAISFWFPSETLCPITLYELGKWTVKQTKWMVGEDGYFKPLFIGVHPEYKRKRDVEIQTHLENSEQRICYSLESLATEIEVAFNNGEL